jgi:uncharacterized protein
MDWILCAAIGVFAGLIAGLFGSAGGVLVPALTLGLPYAGVQGPSVIKVAIASTHAINLFISIAATRSYAGKQGVHWLGLSRTIPGAFIGVIAGAMLAGRAGVTIVTLIYVCAAIYVATRMTGRSAARQDVPEPLPGLIGLSAKGLAAGALAGAAGSAGLFVPMFARYMPLRQAFGNAAAIAFPISLAALSTYALAPSPPGCGPGCVGYVYLPAVCATGVAAVLVAPVGSMLAHSLPVPALKRAFAAVLVVFALNLGRKVLPDAGAITGEAKAALASLQPGVSLCHSRNASRTLRIGSAARAESGQRDGNQAASR